MASPPRMDSLVSSDHSPRRDHLDYHSLDALQYGNEMMDFRQMDSLQSLMNNPTLAKSYSWSQSDLDLSGVIATSGVMSDDDVVPASNNSHANNLQFPPSMADQQQQQQEQGSARGLLPFGAISESISTSTLSSFDSLPPGLSSSVSNSFSGHSLHTDGDDTAVPVLSTPVRTNSRRRSSTLTSTGPNSTLVMSTPQQPAYQTPIRRSTSFTPRRRSHARTRSRLSMDATHALGTNPFYTPPSFLSPKLESPMQQTPIDLFSSHPPASISPQMLMKQDRLATPVQEDDDDDNDDDDGPASGMRKLRALSNYDPNLVIFQNQQPLIDTGLLSQTNPLLVDPENSESIPQRVAPTSLMQRSRSSINLSAIAASKGISRQNSFQEPTPPATASLTGSKSTPSVKISASALVTPTNGSAAQVITPVRGHRRSKSNAPLTAEEELKAKKKIHECPICHNKFQRPEHVKRHMRSHSSEKPYACPLNDCGKKFNRKDNLKQHLRNIHGVEPPKDT